ncbi:MAG TPA: sigma-70 family RNA polymerase sigma factor [Candidatus Acidoferrales bacterium]
MPLRPSRSSAANDSEQFEKPSLASAAARRFPPSLAALVETCWRKADPPAEWNLPRDDFQTALERSTAHRFGAAQPLQEHLIRAYLETLNLRDLALARACSSGNNAAWDFFMAQFRPELYRAARAIVGNAAGGESAARDLADSLCADLYGLRERDGQRQSLFDYFHGRSKLSTWLRAVLARRHVDEIRRTRRTESLEDHIGEPRAEIAAVASASPANVLPDPEQAIYTAILQAALSGALTALDPRDRLRLVYYYIDDRTLAEIGRLLGEHEATVSRKLERTRRDIRHDVESALRRDKKFSDEQLRLCFQYASGQWPFDLTASLRHSGTQADSQAEHRALSTRD